MGRTSVMQRWAIVSKWVEGHDIRKVCSQLGKRKRTVQQWVDRYEATGDVQDSSRSGRRRLLGGAAEQRAYDLLLNGEQGGAQSVAQHLHMTGDVSKVVDRRTVTRAARRIAAQKGQRLRAVQGKPQKMLTAANRRSRLAFCRANLLRYWGNTLFSDRKKFLFSYPGSKVQAVSWVVAGERREAPRVNHPQVVNVYAGLCRFGLTRLHIVAGTSGAQTAYKNQQGKGAKNITKEEYSNVMETTLLPEGRRLFTMQGISTWQLQQDNDRAHNAALPAVRKWNSKHASSISILPGWPPNSPDLNPIENFWGYLQRKMDARGCRSFEEYKIALEEEAKSVPREYFYKLVKGMPKRMACCIELEGGKTRH